MVLDDLSEIVDCLPVERSLLHLVLCIHCRTRADSESVHSCSGKEPRIRDPRHRKQARKWIHEVRGPVGYGEEPNAPLCGEVTHQMRVRLTVRHRTLNGTVRQALFVAISHCAVKALIAVLRTAASRN